jgi:CelD/BcsL family acetyltransferase involved in cellulose biosynthesis
MTAGAVQLRVARTLEEVNDLRDEWASLQNDRVTADPDYYRCILETEPRAIRPHVLLLERDGRPEAMLIARLETVTLPCRLGYKTVYSPKLRSISVVLGGFLGPMTEENVAPLVDELREALRRREADVVLMRHIPLDSSLYAAAARAPSLLRHRASARNRYWEVTLPDSFDEFNRGLSKKTRDSFKRYANRFTREFGDRITLREFRRPEEIDELSRDIETVAAKSWQRGLGVGFVDDERQRARTALALRLGWLRALVLYVDEQPIAFWTGDAYRGRFRSQIPGYDPAYKDYRVGNFILLRLIERLCEDEAVEVLDFGFGDVEYKERLAERSWWAADAAIFAPSLKGVRVNLTRTALVAANAGALRLMRSAGVLGKVKRGWRGRFTGAGAPPADAPQPTSERAAADGEAVASRAGGDG